MKKKLQYVMLMSSKLLLYGIFSQLLLIGILKANTGTAQNNSVKDVYIEIDAQNTKILDVFYKIEKQTDFRFVYDRDYIDDKIKLNVSGRWSVNDVLLKISKETRLRFKQINNLINVRPIQNAYVPEENKIEVSFQSHTITGKVVTEDNGGEGLPGVNIVVKGTNLGTITDTEGKYSLEVPSDDVVLVYSFLGYVKEEIPLEGRSVIDVSLIPDIKSLSEVIVTGYNEIRKESFTGTTVTVTGDELKQANPVNIFQAIQLYDPSFRIQENTLNGSNPNSLPDISVRGSTGLPTADNALQEEGELDFNRASLTNNPNLPTFILDGFQVNVQTVFDININRVESITILKDAASAAIYGSRAANGVVVITTRPPEEGKLQVTYNMDVNISWPDLTVYDVLNAEEKLEYERLAGLYSSSENDADEELLSLDPDDRDELYYLKKKNIVSGVDTYWLSEPVETSIGSNHSLYVEGGSKTLRYGVTARYQNLNGVMKGSGRKRYGGDISLIYNINDKFYLTNRLTVTDVKASESPYGNFSEYVRMNPYYPKTDEDGNVLQVVDSWQRRDFDANSAIVQDNVLNPAFNATLSNFDEERYTQIIDALNARWIIADGFELRGLLSLNKTQYDYDRYYSPFSNVFYNESNVTKKGQYDYAHKNETSIDGNITLAYNRVLNEKHIINTAVGGNIRDYVSDYKSFTATGFSSDRFDNIQFANRYKENSSPTGIEEVDRLLGFFGTLNYSFNDKYLLDVSGRLDGSSKFGSDNRFAPFWAAGLGWNIHNEEFLRGNDIVNRLRIRGTTGLTGEVSFPSYMSKTTYEYKGVWYSTGVGAVNMGFGNEDLSWQRTRNYDLGLEVAMFKNRIILNPRVYYRLTEDLLADIVVPPSVGFLSYKSNLGEMENKGIEAILQANVIQSKNGLFMSLFANMAHNQNTITKISESLKKYNDEIDDRQEEEEYRGRPLLRYREGESLNTIYGVRSLGIDPETGQEIYVKADGTLTYEYDVKDIVPIGDSSPLVEGSFGTNISYKNLFLSVNFYTSLGGDMYNQTLVDRVENADPRFNADQRVLDQRWRAPGDVVFFKDIADQLNTRTTSRFIQSGDMLELRSASLSYDSYGKLARSLKMENIRFMVTMNDIWRWAPVEAERGIDYPFARTVTFSLQARF